MNKAIANAAPWLLSIILTSLIGVGLILNANELRKLNATNKAASAQIAEAIKLLKDRREKDHAK